MHGEINSSISSKDCHVTQSLKKKVATLEDVMSELEQINTNMLSKDDLDIISSFLRFIAANQLMQDPLASDIVRKSLACVDRVHIFFNCDENKSEQSINICYNDKAYGDTPAGRAKLLDRVLEEETKKSIFINSDDLQKVKEIITNGAPVDASQYLKYGCIRTINVYH